MSRHGSTFCAALFASSFHHGFSAGYCTAVWLLVVKLKLECCNWELRAGRPLYRHHIMSVSLQLFLMTLFCVNNLIGVYNFNAL